MMRFCLLAALAVVSTATNDCVMGEWGDWTEWTRLDCGEEFSGAVSPIRGKYQEHRVGDDPVSTMQEGRAFCIGGLVGDLPCSNVDQMARFTDLDLCGGNGADSCMFQNDLEGKQVYGWVDPGTSEEYALMGFNHGTSFVRLSTDFNLTLPETLAWMDGSNAGQSAGARTIAVKNNYAYITGNITGHGLQILDLSVLPGIVDTYPDFPITKLTPTLTSAIFDTAINFVNNPDPNVLMVAGAQGGSACSGGLLSLDISNPLIPAVIGCYSGSGVINDAHCVDYTGRDEDYYDGIINGTVRTEICFAANGTNAIVLNAEDKTNILFISAGTYFNSEFISQCMVDRRHVMLMTGDDKDELANPVDQRTRTHLWTLNDLEVFDQDGLFTAEYFAVDSRMYVVGQWVYQANYEAGYVVLRVDEIVDQLFQIGYLDTILDDPTDGQVLLDGAVDVFPYFVNPTLNNGNVLVSTKHNGLYIVRTDTITANMMTEERLTLSERYRYREIISATDRSKCPNTVEAEERKVDGSC